ncbi:MFS transporter [Streptomyces sp. NPDC015184]|uniref:MFS transporter n=1 Tax=Streptomyces sp. NPDC015184 TaxID=3364946 RepID=UPI0037032A9D
MTTVTDSRRAEWSALLGSPVFLVLWGAMLASSTGTFFLLLTVSTHLLTETDSGLTAASVFGFQWVLPVLLMGVIRRACAGERLRRTVVLCEVAGGLVSLSIGLLLDRGLLAPVLVAFLLRGLLEGITKTARVVYTRQLFDGPLLKPASYTFNNSYYLGGALGGGLGAVLVDRVPITTACAIDAATFLVSACCYRWLPAVTAPRSGTDGKRGVLGQVRAAARENPRLALSAGYFVVAVGVFQGYHNVARTTVPIRVLGLGDAAAMTLQLVSGVGLVAGAVAAPLLLQRVRAPRYLAAATNAATALAISVVPLAGGPIVMYGCYFAYLAVFEFSFTAAQAAMIQDCPPDRLLALTTFTNAAGNGLLILVTLAVGALSDVASFETITLALAAAAVGGTAVGEVLTARRTAPRNTTKPPAPAVSPEQGADR